MTVAELIARLQIMPADAEVIAVDYGGGWSLIDLVQTKPPDEAPTGDMPYKMLPDATYFVALYGCACDRDQVNCPLCGEPESYCDTETPFCADKRA